MRRSCPRVSGLRDESIRAPAIEHPGPESASTTKLRREQRPHANDFLDVDEPPDVVETRLAQHSGSPQHALVLIALREPCSQARDSDGLIPDEIWLRVVRLEPATTCRLHPPRVARGYRRPPA